MQKAKKLGLLCGALLVVSATAFGVSRLQTHKEKIQSGEEVILTIPTDSVTALSWKTTSTDLAFTKNDDGSWTYTGDEAFPVSTTEIENLLASFENLETAFTIDEVEDLSQYGLDEPLCTVQFTANDQEYTVEMGDYSSMDSQRYASIEDGKVYLLKSDLYETFDTQLSSVIQNDSLPNFDSISSGSFIGVDDYTFTKDEDQTLSYCESDQYYTEGKALETEKVDSYISTLKYLGLSEYATYNLSDDDLKTYGLDNPVLTGEISYTDEDEDGNAVDGTFKYELGVNSDELSKAVKAGTYNEDGTPVVDASTSTDEDSDSEDSVPTFYLRINDSKIVYILSESTYKSLIAAKYDDLRHDEVLKADFNDITSIDISLDGETYTLTSKGEDDDKTWYYGDEEIDISSFSDSFKAVKASSFTDGNPSEKEEISFVLHLDNGNFPEVSLAFYRYNGDFCISTEGDQPVSMVARSSVVDLIEAVNAIIL